MAVVKEVEKEEAVQEKTTGLFVGGEVRIVADGKTGGISVQAPENMVVALGLLELAKVILVEKKKEDMKTAPVVKPATAAELAALTRKPS